MRLRGAFTLIEVLISIALMGLIIPALYQTVDLLHDSNQHLWGYVQKSKKEVQTIQTLYLDIASSDGNITLRKGEFDRLCMENTRNSLYGLSGAKVCWVVLKENHTLVRAEGSEYHLPVRMDERVEVDPVMRDLELFDVYWNGDKVLVLIRQQGRKPITFLVQGITKPKVKKPKKKKTGIKRKGSTVRSKSTPVQPPMDPSVPPKSPIAPPPSF